MFPDNFTQILVYRTRTCIMQTLTSDNGEKRWKLCSPTVENKEIS